MNIFPSYRCNSACSFCDMHKRNPSLLMDLDWLEETIKHIPKQHHATILGGDPSLLKPDYLERLIHICKEATGKPPELDTSLLKIPPHVEEVELAVSFDMDLRKKPGQVIRNIYQLENPFDFAIIVSHYLVHRGSRWLKEFAKRFERLNQIELAIPIQFPGHEDMTPDFETFAGFCKDLAEYPDTKISFPFMDNITNKMENCSLKAKEEADEIVEILPNQKFCLPPRDDIHMQEFDSWGQASDYYLDLVKNSDNKCYRCKDFYCCPKMYRDDDCYRDKAVMEVVRKAKEGVS